MSLNGRIKERRKQIRLTQPEFAKAVNSSLATIRRWESGRTVPDGDKIKEIAQALNTTGAYLMGETDNPNRSTDENISFDGEAYIARIPEKLVKIKVLSFSACMGGGFDNEGESVDIIDELLLPIGDVGVMGPEEPFAVEVQGQSMSPTIEDGVRVIVNPNIMPGRGEVCMARFLMRGYMRDAIKFYHPTPDGGIILKSSEKSGVPPMEFSSKEVNDGDVKIVGRVMSYNITVRL